MMLGTGSFSEGKTRFYLKPKFIFTCLCAANLLNYVDRGIIPGSTNEINSFIKSNIDTSTPDVFLGLLQSAFIIGFMGGSIAFGHLIHTYGRFTLTGIGCAIWIVAVMLSGSAYYANSYVFLLFARMLSGIAEASMQVSVPPWIQKVAPLHQKGLWLGFFYMAIPVGTAIGYAYSSIVSEAIGWQWAFFFEGFVMVPFVSYMFLISSHFPPDTPKTEEGANHPTVWQEFLVVCGRPIFLCFSFAYAAQSAVLMGLSTFGSAFMMGLGFFNTESEASTIFGVVISLAGMISTPVGGILLDKLMADHRSRASEAAAAVAGTGRSPSVIEELLGELDEQQQNSSQLAPLVAATEEVGEEVNDMDAARTGCLYSDKRIKALKTISVYVGVLNLIGGVVLAVNYFCYNKVLWLFMVAVGCSLIFMTTSGITMGVMLSVPISSQSFAIAMNSICLHGFGDVPSPVIVGLIKDTLAPGCIAGNDDDGNVAASTDCRDDGQGLRMTMLLTTVWIAWTVFFYVLAWFFLKNDFHLLPFGLVDYRGDGQEQPPRDPSSPSETAIKEGGGTRNVLWQSKNITGAADNDGSSSFSAHQNNNRTNSRNNSNNNSRGGSFGSGGHPGIVQVKDDYDEENHHSEQSQSLVPSHSHSHSSSSFSPSPPPTLSHPNHNEQQQNQNYKENSDSQLSYRRSLSGEGLKSRILSPSDLSPTSVAEKHRNIERLKQLSREEEQEEQEGTVSFHDEKKNKNQKKSQGTKKNRFVSSSNESSSSLKFLRKSKKGKSEEFLREMEDTIAI
jgi:MFS family permease